MSKFKRVLFVSTVTGLAAIGGIGCDGSTTGGGFSEARGTTFVASESNTGSFDVSLNSSTLEVSGSTGFSGRVVNADGQGISGLQVTCDTESGLVLIDPVSGRFLTNANGEVSGVVGCERPGSFMMGCRLPSGADARVFEQVVCTGDVPSGFTGFPESGGGTLGEGGGVTPPESGGPGQADPGTDFQGQVRITSIEVRDVFGDLDVVPQIDLTREYCDAGTPDDTSDDFFEVWGDDEVVLKISNDTDREITFSGFQYDVKGGAVGGGDGRSPFIRVVGRIEARSSGLQLEGTIFDADINGKTFADGSTPISLETAPRNVRFTVYGVTDRGEEVQVSASTNFNFDGYDNCGRSE
jgi:hypothetical protein